MGLLGEIERMVGPGERRFQIAQDSIDRAKLLQLHAGSTAVYGHFGRDDLALPWETVI